MTNFLQHPDPERIKIRGKLLARLPEHEYTELMTKGRVEIAAKEREIVAWEKKQAKRGRL